MMIDWNKLPGVPGMRPGSERKGICGEKISAVRIETTADAVFDGKTHWHDNEQIVVMVSGMSTFVIDGKEVMAHAGEMLFFPVGSRHAAVGTGQRAASITKSSPPLGLISSRAGLARRSFGSTEFARTPPCKRWRSGPKSSFIRSANFEQRAT